MKNAVNRFTKLEWSWIFQDWANSAYSLMITTAIFPIYYKSLTDGAGIASHDSTAYLGYANSISTIIIAVMAPFLGTLADFKGVRKPLFSIGTLLGILSVFAMIFVKSDLWLWLLILYGLSHMGFSMANIFYDASIMDVTTYQRMDMVSATGFGFGYIGSVIPFLVFMLLNFSGVFTSTTTVYIGFIMTALWWFVFTIPYWKNVKQTTFRVKETSVITESIQSLSNTLKEIKKYPNIMLFLIAYFFYIDGVGTIIAMATAVGSDKGLTSQELILMLLVVQIVAFPCSMLYGYLSKQVGNKRMLFIGIFTYVIICFLGLRLNAFKDFVVLAILVGSAQGGIQALSRSYFGQIIPRDKSNQFFGFYNIFGKFSSILGTTILAVVAQMTGDSLKGLFAIIIEFLLGAFLLALVKPPHINEEDAS